MIALLLAAALAASPPLEPNPALTPGAVNPAATLQVICIRGYTSRPGVRHVTPAAKRAAFARYGVDRAIGGPYEIDHLVSLELGGSNEAANLWPESYVTSPWNAHVKDALENRLHALVCAGRLPLAQAQREIAADWIAAFRRYVAPAP